MRPPTDPAELVGRVAGARRELLLRAHRRRLRREDLEDCYGQAVLEMVVRARSGTPFEGVRHIANALEQRFISRIHDRRRAISGRSPMLAALETAVPFGQGDDAIEIRDRREEPERVAIARAELQELVAAAATLSPDQRVVLEAQLAGFEPAEIQRAYGWSAEKCRKTALRARVRLKAVIDGRGVSRSPAGVGGEGEPAYDPFSPHS